MFSMKTNINYNLRNKTLNPTTTTYSLKHIPKTKIIYSAFMAKKTELYNIIPHNLLTDNIDTFKINLKHIIQQYQIDRIPKFNYVSDTED